MPTKNHYPHFLITLRPEKPYAMNKKRKEKKIFTQTYKFVTMIKVTLSFLLQYKEDKSLSFIQR